MLFLMFACFLNMLDLLFYVLVANLSWETFLFYFILFLNQISLKTASKNVPPGVVGFKVHSTGEYLLFVRCAADVK